MKRGNIVINDKGYILGSNGVLVDEQGNLCGFVSSDIVKQAGLEADTEILVDRIKPEVSKRVQTKIEMAKEKDVVITGSAVAAGIAIGIAVGAAVAVWESGILDNLP